MRAWPIRLFNPSFPRLRIVAFMGVGDIRVGACILVSEPCVLAATSRSLLGVNPVSRDHETQILAPCLTCTYVGVSVNPFD